MKTITMTDLRSEPGERLRDVQREGMSFLITKSGKPAALLVPVDDVTTIERDGTIRGEPPLSAKVDRRGGY